MSSHAYVYLTKFIELDLEGSEVKTLYGLQVVDYYNSTYTVVSKKNEVLNKSPVELLKLAYDIDSISRDIIDSAKENDEGIFIANEYFKWNDLKE